MEGFEELPERLRFMDKVAVTESQRHEFKAMQITANLLVAAREFFRTYMNGFVNSSGGTLWLGVEDNSEVKGLEISEGMIQSLLFVFN